MKVSRPIRLGADIGGTFTDIVLECGGKIFSRRFGDPAKRSSEASANDLLKGHRGKPRT